MAGSRLEYVGTIFSRTTGLLRTKAIKYEDRPIWYDVYRVFPPKFEPRADRQPELSEGMADEVPSILYNEDVSRAALFKKFGKNPGGKARNLMNVAGSLGEGEEGATRTGLDATKRFIQKYTETKSAHGDWTPEQIVESISQDFVGNFGSGGLVSRKAERVGTETIATEPEGISVSESMIGTKKSAERRFASSLMHEDDVDDEDLNSEGAERKKRVQRPIVTVDTLISMFKKTKEKDDLDKGKK